MNRVTPEEARSYYEDFASIYGSRAGFIHPNARHERLRKGLASVLGRRRGLGVLDVGCGTGVMTSHLRRYGTVNGMDFSAPAIEIARRMVPGVTFRVGTVTDLAPAERYDLITLFDVVEHIPKTDRPAFFESIAAHLAPGGFVFASTPHPRYTAWVRETKPEILQVIDELVELEDVLVETARAGLQLVRFEVFDVWAGSPEYQFFVLAPQTEPGGPARFVQPPSTAARLAQRRSPGRRRRAALAFDLARHGRLGTARWVLSPDRRRPPQA